MGRNIKQILWRYYQIKKGQAIGFFVADSENLKFQHVPYKAKAKNKMKSMQKKKTGGFLNRYDFAYAGRDAVNQACKVAPGVIKGATKEIDNILNVELIT